jgi:hypothetical protein
MGYLETARRILSPESNSEDPFRKSDYEETKETKILQPGTCKTCETPGSSPDCPMLDVPANDWRWAVANWPHDRWALWRRRVAVILAEADELVLIEDREDVPRADAEEIRAAERRAFDELTGFAGVASPPFVVRATS